MSKSELFVKYHGKQIIAAFIVVVATITWQVVREERAINPKNTGAVMGETASNLAEEEQAKNKQLIVAYQAGLKNELTDYLSKRAGLENNKEAWQIAIATAKNNILALSVPNDYKDLQVKVVTAFDLEQEALREDNAAKKKAAEDRWAEILEQYFWLNK
ncbi:MAG TPA: hypothetical protein P5267_02980 [Patescibacteria group bacterium]|nr:hypothetical protein [Patescibacteria group bacterium]